MPHIKNALIRYRVIDKALRNKFHPYPTKLDLRRACEMELYGQDLDRHISDSTIEKDLYAMRNEMDAPIAYSKIEKGYFYTDSSFTIDEQPLSEDDIASIQFAASTLSQFKDTAMFQQFGMALNKIIDRINVDTQNRNKKEIDQFIQFEQGVANTGNEYLNVLLTAIKKRHIAYFAYESFITQIKKNRKVTPLLLKEYDNRWYLISFDMVKEKVITYALDRMSELEVVTDEGVTPTDFNPDLYFRHAIGITASPEARPQEIIFEATTIAAKYIASQPFHKSQEIVEKDEKKTQFKLFALVSEELIRALLSYGGDVTVYQPQDLKEELVHRISKMKENYGID